MLHESKGRRGKCCYISNTNRMRIISILIRYCLQKYYQSYSCWPAASWCSLSRALEKWWPPRCEQSSRCSCPPPGSTGTSRRPGEWPEPDWGHSHPPTPSRWSSARTWCRCLLPGDEKTSVWGSGRAREETETHLSDETVLTVQLPPGYFWQELL